MPLAPTDRIFHGVEAPYIEIWESYIDGGGEEIGRLVSDAYGYLNVPKIRTVQWAKDEVVRRLENSGEKVNWIKGRWLKGKMVWDKIDWDTAELIIKASQYEKFGLDSIAPNGPYLKIHYDDPLWISFRITNDIEFPLVGGKMIGHSCTMEWEGMIRWPHPEDIEDFFSLEYLSW